MENAPDPGPRSKPTRPQGRQGASNRKPQPPGKPAAKGQQVSKTASSKTPRPRATPTKPDAAAETQLVVEPTSELEPTAASTAASMAAESEAAADATAESPTTSDAAASAPADLVAAPEHLVVPRLNVPRLNLPKLTLPKFSMGGGVREEIVIETPELTGAAPSETPPEGPVEPAPEGPTEPDREPEAEPDPQPDPQPAPEAEPEPEPQPEPEPVVTALEVVEPKKRAAKSNSEVVLLVEGLTKRFDDTLAVNAINLEVKVGAFYGIVGPNGAGKTTTLSMITGLLRPDAGSVAVHGADVWSDPVVAKRNMGVLPDRLRLFDRLTGAQVLYYSGVLRGLDDVTVRKRTADLAAAFGLGDALARLVTDYSAGMTKKIALAAAMIHSPRILVLDEPFESVDPVSAATITEILKNYVDAGGTVLLSSHSMDLVQRICDYVAVIVGGVILADGTMGAVRGTQTLEERFVELAGGRKSVEGLEWLHSFSD